MKKILTLVILSLLLVSCGEKIENTKIETQKEKNEKVVAQKFADLTKYIKGNITDEESEKLSEILKQRVERQAEIKKLIEDATKETANETYEKIVEKRKICVGRISPFIDEVQKSSFLRYCEKINFSIKKKLDSK